MYAMYVCMHDCMYVHVCMYMYECICMYMDANEGEKEKKREKTNHQKI